MPSPTGNRLTENALNADDGKALIERALGEIKAAHGWTLRDETPIFSGIYYDSQKVGSFIARALGPEGAPGVLKLQLRPLPFDEGFITRHIQPQIKSVRIQLPKIFIDEPWSDSTGYGFLVTEDLTDLPRLWAGHSPTEAEMTRHETFLDEFMHHVLPITPYLPAPTGTMREKYREAFDHFSAIAKASAHRHIAPEEVDQMAESYFRILDHTAAGGFHFTHGHLSGMEIKEDPNMDSFILFSNLLWSFRPTYYEVIFPLWVDIMGIRDANVTLNDLLARVDRWATIWKNVQDEDPRESPFFWFLLLERAMMTVMLDLGASEWTKEEQTQKQALLEAWKELHHRIAKEKL